MHFPTKDHIRQLAGTKIYARGLSYWEDEKVRSLNKNEAGSHTKITAEVNGTKRYDVQLLFHEDGELQQYSCSCPAHQDMMDICKHITAVLLYLSPVSSPENKEKKRKRKRPLGKDNEQSDEMKQLFMDHFTGRMQSVEENGEPVQAEYTLSFQSDYDRPQEQFFTVQLKIGAGKRYIIKDVGDLFASLRERSLLPITKTFTFDPTYHYFREEDRSVLLLLEDIFINQQWSGRQTSLFQNSNTKAQPEIIVPPLAAEPLLYALSACANVYVKPKLGGNTVPFLIKQQWPGTFHLTKEKENYYLGYSSFDYPPKHISLTPFYTWNDRLYELPREDSETTRLLFHMLMKTPKGRIKLEKGEVEQVYNKLSILKQQGRLSVEKTVDNQIADYQLQSKVYLDKKGDALLADPQFVYGPHSFHAITEERHYSEETTIIARDTDREERFLQHIEAAGFHWNGESLSITDSHMIFNFLTKVLPALHKETDVFMSHEVEELLLSPSFYRIESSLDESRGWLDISFRTDDLDEDELQALMTSLKEKKQYHRTNSGKYVPLDDDTLQGLQELMEETGIQPADWEHGSVRLPAFKSFQAERLLNTGRQWNKSESVEELLRDIRSPELLETPLPSHLEGVLRNYQERGFQWLKALSSYGFGGILADDMGLGKTLQTLSYIASEREEYPESPPFLVAAPSSLIFNWQKEAERFVPDLNVRLIYGPKSHREQQLQNLQEVDIFITSYPLLRRDVDLYEGISFHGFILDEAQALKNHTSKTFRAAKRIRANRIFAISGTPIENKIDELWSLFAILMPGLFPDIESFKQLPSDHIRHRVAPFILRRTKKEVLTELPDKLEMDHHCELTKEQRETYVAYLNRIKQETAAHLNSGTFKEQRMNILANLTRLRQLCCHPGMFIENYTGGSGKLSKLMAVMEEARLNGNRVLVFSQFTTMLSIIARAFQQAGIDYFYLDGSTPSNRRVGMTEEFNSGEKDAFLISLKAGGTGLNLTGADTVILFDLWWNPAVESQAADRAHRIGQKRVVQVIKLISQGTIEEKILALQHKKKALFDQVIQSGETNISSLSEEDIRELLDI